jgi:hypothetical protein
MGDGKIVNKPRLESFSLKARHRGDAGPGEAMFQVCADRRRILILVLLVLNEMREIEQWAAEADH